MLAVVAASTLDYVVEQPQLGGPAYYIGMAALHINSQTLLVTTKSSVSDFLKRRSDFLNVLSIVEVGDGETIFKIDILGDNRSLKLIKQSKIEVRQALEVVKKCSAVVVSTTYSELNLEELSELARERIVVVDIQGFIRKAVRNGGVVHDTQRVFKLGRHLRTSKRAILRGERSEFPVECWADPLRCSEELKADIVITSGREPFKVVSYSTKCFYEVEPLQGIYGESIGLGDVFTEVLAHYLINENLEFLEAAAIASIAASLKLRNRYPWFTIHELEILKDKIQVLREVCDSR
ncbi:MAG: hypothetical protein RMI56_05975 [Sulfolobales archaeon]|nr:hypothetical protein [Sulfolobales archaeon]MDW8083324.1 hypothetical protein [Sulfolobales archaeon]